MKKVSARVCAFAYVDKLGCIEQTITRIRFASKVPIRAWFVPASRSNGHGRLALRSSRRRGHRIRRETADFAGGLTPARVCEGASLDRYGPARRQRNGCDRRTGSRQVKLCEMQGEKLANSRPPLSFPHPENLVELRGFEPLTSAVRLRRSPI